MADDFRKQKLYTKHYSDEQILEEKSRMANDLFDKVCDLIGKPKRILDVGCGEGSFGYKFSSEFGAEVHGMEINPKAILSAKSRGMFVKKADIEKKWPYKSNTFDLVMGVQVVEHLVNPDIFVQESRRVLRSGGLLLISTPNLASWYNRGLLFLGYQPFFTEVSTKDKTFGLGFTRKLTATREPVGHLRIFTLRALVDILNYYNFNVVKKMGGDVNYFPNYISYVDRILSKVPGLGSDIIVVAKKE